MRLKDTFIVPVPKKDNLQSCDNYQGTTLVDVLVKVLDFIIQK